MTMTPETPTTPGKPMSDFRAFFIKNSESAEDCLRTLYREGLLSSGDAKDRLSQLGRPLAGELKPVVH